MTIRSCLLALMTCLMLSPALAVIDTYQFDNTVQEERFFSLTHELRCPKCQNQSIADSDAPIANDLRREVHRMLLAGEDDQTIVDFMLTRYGDFILYRPPMESKTALLWAGPPILLLTGFLILFFIVRRHRQAAPRLDEEESFSNQRSKEDGL